MHTLLHFRDAVAAIGTLIGVWQAAMERKIARSKDRIRNYRHVYLHLARELKRAEVASLLKVASWRPSPAPQEHIEGPINAAATGISDIERFLLASLLPPMGLDPTDARISRGSRLVFSDQRSPVRSLHSGNEKESNRSARHVLLTNGNFAEVHYFLEIDSVSTILRLALGAIFVGKGSVGRCSAIQAVELSQRYCLVNVDDIVSLVGVIRGAADGEVTHMYER